VNLNPCSEKNAWLHFRWGSQSKLCMGLIIKVVHVKRSTLERQPLISKRNKLCTFVAHTSTCCFATRIVARWLRVYLVISIWTAIYNSLVTKVTFSLTARAQCIFFTTLKTTWSLSVYSRSYHLISGTGEHARPLATTRWCTDLFLLTKTRQQFDFNQPTSS
jgi:hypothetical protein